MPLQQQQGTVTTAAGQEGLAGWLAGWRPDGQECLPTPMDKHSNSIAHHNCGTTLL
jgi:hypothetical protein